jgi:hypothetical protein
MSDLMMMLYGKDGDEGLSKEIRDFVTETVEKYFSGKSYEEIQSYLDEIDDDDEFPQFEMNWYEVLNDYQESR